MNLKKLLCLLMAVCLVASFSVAALAVDVDTENDREIIDMTHIDVKKSAKYYAEIDGETVVLDADVVPETIVITVTTPAANFVYDFGNYNVITLTEKGMTEYRIILDGTDGALLNAIDWAGASFYMNNVYVSTRLVFEEVPEALAAEMNKDANGNYYVDVSFRYTGMQECTGHNGLRSEGNHGYILGVDLYLGAVPGMSVETPEDPTDPSEDPSNPTKPTDPEDPSNPTKPTDPEDPSNPTKPADPEDPSNPTKPADPEDPSNPTNPADPEDPSNPTKPADPEDPSNPSNPADPEDPTVPETTEPPVDDVPETADNSKLIPLMVLMGISVVGMAATSIISKKLEYVGKWE